MTIYLHLIDPCGEKGKWHLAERQKSQELRGSVTCIFFTLSV